MRYVTNITAQSIVSDHGTLGVSVTLRAGWGAKRECSRLPNLRSMEVPTVWKVTGLRTVSHAAHRMTIVQPTVSVNGESGVIPAVIPVGMMAVCGTLLKSPSKPVLVVHSVSTTMVTRDGSLVTLTLRVQSTAKVCGARGAHVAIGVRVK